MKKLFYMISAVALMASFASCNKIEQGNTSAETPSVDGTTTITVSASVPKTKVLFMEKDQNTLRWTSGDVVTLFGENGSSLTSTAQETGTNSNFTFAGWPAEDTPRYLVYNGALLDEIEEGRLQRGSYVRPPVFEDGKVTMTVRTSQSITNDYSFGKHANLSIGALVLEADGGYTTEMKNVCGVIKFSFANKEKIKVKNVLIRNVDASASPMAGMVKVDYNDGVPTAEVIDGTGKTEVLVKAKDDGFENKYYCACILPGIYEPEIVLNYDIDGVEPITLRTRDGAKIEIKRNEVFDFGVIDKIELHEQPGTGEGGEGGDDPVTPPSPTKTLTLTVDFSAWPFQEAVVNSRITTTAEGNEYTFVHDGENYKFTIINTVIDGSCKGFYWRGATLGIQGNDSIEKGVTGDFEVRFPVVKDMKLTSVAVSVANAEANKKFVKILNVGGGTVVSDNVHNENSPKVFEIPEPVVSSSYSLTSGGKNIQLLGLILTYTN